METSVASVDANGTAMATTLPYQPWNLPFLGEEEIAEVVDTLRSGWLTTGPKVDLLEAQVRDMLGVAAAFAVSSCTAALHLSLLAAGVGPGDEVITPSLTFCAVANVIVSVGATPVFVDVCADSLNVDPVLAEAAMTSRTRAIVVMHYGGHPCRTEAFRAIAETHGVLLIEDAAHGLGASQGGRPVGSFGDVAVFSFYANKNVTTGEGGMLVGSTELVERARLLGRHGIDRTAWQRHGNRGSAAYDVVLPGLKYNMPDILAAIGIHQLRRLPGFIARRAAIAARYSANLRELAGIEVPVVEADVESAWHLYAIRISHEVCGVDRAAVAERLAAAGIGTSVHFTPVHHTTFYRRFVGPAGLPVTDAVAQRLLSLPCYPGMSDEAVDRVIEAMCDALAGASATSAGAIPPPSTVEGYR
jgi:dTDP-4-amino-4,6-dideoxygalactose transaminase